MIAARRAALPATTAAAEAPGPGIRTGHRRYAGFRTRVLEVGPGPLEPPAVPGRRKRRSTATSSAKTAATPTTPRLVLLHGFRDSADTWRPLLAELGAAGYAAIAVDLPGAGEATPLRPGAMLPQLDAFTAAVIKEQAAQGSVVLVGNSLGATVSLRAAQDPWLRIGGVVSIAAPGFVDSWLIRTVAAYPLPLRLYASLPLPVPGFVVRAVVEQVVPRLLYADADTAEEAHVRRFVDQLSDHASTTARLEEARELVAELANAYQLDRITAPLLVVACGKDRLVSAASGRQLHSLVPHSRLLVREDWGHCPQLDDPPALAELLTYFTAGARHQRKATATPPQANLVSAQTS